MFVSISKITLSLFNIVTKRIQDFSFRLTSVPKTLLGMFRQSFSRIITLNSHLLVISISFYGKSFFPRANHMDVTR